MSNYPSSPERSPRVELAPLESDIQALVPEQVTPETAPEVETDEQAARLAAAHERLAAVEERPDDAIEAAGELGPTYPAGAASEAEKLNEDHFAIHADGRMVACDGVGSSEHGFEASELATKYIDSRLAEIPWDATPADAMEKMRKLLMEAHVLIRSEEELTGRSMASTATAVRIVRDDQRATAVIGNVGDSSVYLKHDDKLAEITNYHGRLPDPKRRPALGKPTNFEPKVLSLKLEPGDRLVVTTNGVRKNDPKLEKMQKILKKQADPQKTAERIVTRLKGKSPDARTALILDFGQY